MENFSVDDMIRYKELNYFIEYKKIKKLLDVNYIDVEFKKIIIPNKLFSYLLIHRRKDLLKYLPFNVKIKKLERGENRWLQKTNYLGLYTPEEKSLTLCLNIDYNYSEVELLWILFHEFRHHIQFQNNSIKSCIDNENVNKWLEFYNMDNNKIFHVFHEILPFEVDANIFASDILNIKYPGSKFNITNETLNLLKI